MKNINKINYYSEWQSNLPEYLKPLGEKLGEEQIESQDFMTIASAPDDMKNNILKSILVEYVAKVLEVDIVDLADAIDDAEDMEIQRKFGTSPLVSSDNPTNN